MFDVQEQISKAAAFSLTAGGMGATRFANPSQALQQVSANRILQQVGLNRVENIEGERSRQLVQPLGESFRLDVYHYGVYTTQYGCTSRCRLPCGVCFPASHLCAENAQRWGTLDLVVPAK